MVGHLHVGIAGCRSGGMSEIAGCRTGGMSDWRDVGMGVATLSQALYNLKNWPISLISTLHS